MSYFSPSKMLILTVATVLFTMGAAMTNPAKADSNPIVVMETSKGAITIELYPDNAPETVKNFLWYVDKKFYEGLVFHRVIADFMIQGGGFTADMVKKQPNPPITNEADNGLKNDRGTIAMARTSEINSASSQFFINLKNNDFLNFKDKSPRGYGYAVFGKVIEGMDVVDAIGGVTTVTKEGYNDVPKEPIVITKAYRSEAEPKKGKAEKAE